jgi:uncharacterized protein
VDVHILLLGGLSVVVAALVQGTLGLGLSLLAARVVALLDPTLMPGGMLVLTWQSFRVIENCRKGALY